MPVNSPYNPNINWQAFLRGDGLAQDPNDGIAARIRKMLGNSPYGMTPGINPNAPSGPIGGAAVDPSMVGPQATMTPQDYAAILRAQSGQAANEIEAARSLQQQASDTSPLAVGDPGFGAVARVLAGVRGRRDMKRARTGFEETIDSAGEAMARKSVDDYEKQMRIKRAEIDAADSRSLKSVMDPETGQPTLVRASEAEGMQPAPRSPLVTVGGEPSPYGKKIAEKLADERDEISKAAGNATSMVASTEQMLTLLDSFGPENQGAFADAKLDAARILHSFGANDFAKDLTGIDPTEADAGSAARALAIRGAAEWLAKNSTGPKSNFELEQAMKSFPGIAKNPTANILLSEVTNVKAGWDTYLEDKAIEYEADHGGELDSGWAKVKRDARREYNKQWMPKWNALLTAAKTGDINTVAAVRSLPVVSSEDELEDGERGILPDGSIFVQSKRR